MNITEAKLLLQSFSSDLDEILHYSDRILVFFAGRVSEPLDAATTTVDQLGQLIGGKGW